MVIVCAWCEREGHHAVLYTMPDDSSSVGETVSHGICKAHCDQLLDEMTPLCPAVCLPHFLPTSAKQSLLKREFT
jgi:hypothetical protein